VPVLSLCPGPVQFTYTDVPRKRMFVESSKSRSAPGRRQSWELRTTTAEAESSPKGYVHTASEQGLVGDSDRMQGQGPCQGMGTGVAEVLQT